MTVKTMSSAPRTLRVELPRDADERCDVLVIGAGGAGLAAACAAAEAGAKVVVLESLDGCKGTTSWSVGSFAAANTRLQKAAGIEDDAQAFYDDIAVAFPQTPDTEPLRRMLARESGPTLAWLEKFGLVLVGPFPEPPNRCPRMHNAVPAGIAYLEVMAAHARKLGVAVRYKSRVRELAVEDGVVRGARYELEGAGRFVAARSVVLASGDFSGSSELRQAYLSAPAAAALPINPCSLGDGHRMARDAGAQMKRMEGVFGPQLRFAAAPHAPWFSSLPSWRWLRKLAAAVLTHAPRAVLGQFARQLLVAHMSPVPALFQAGAIIVDTSGVQIGVGADPASDLAGRPGATGYIIGNAAIAERFSRFPDYISTAPGVAFAYFRDYERGRPDLLRWADDSRQLADRIGCDPGALAAATKSLEGRLFALGPVKAMLTVTEGGAATDDHGRVLRPDGESISGLYAAGGIGQGGLMLKGHGLHLAWAITSGRNAGRHAAQGD